MPDESFTAPAPLDDSLHWLASDHRPSPGEALPRIRAICEQRPDLFAALLAVVATHQGLRHEVLAAAVKRYRRDLDPFTQDDVSGMLTACWNGGWQGFDAVLRSRRQKGRVAGTASLGWVKE